MPQHAERKHTSMVHVKGVISSLYSSAVASSSRLSIEPPCAVTHIPFAIDALSPSLAAPARVPHCSPALGSCNIEVAQDHRNSWDPGKTGHAALLWCGLCYDL